MQQNKQKQRKGTTTGISFDRMAPQCGEAEKAVIGALLIQSDAIHEVYSLLKKEYFYNEAIGEIYDTVKTIWETGGKPDLIRVCEELKKRGTLEEVGGMFYLAQLSGNVGTTSNIREHAEYVHQSYLQRQLILSAQMIIASASDPTVDVGDAIGESLTMLENLAASMEYGNGAKPISEAVRKSLEDYAERERLRKEGKSVGITTGLRVLDKHLNGLQRKQLVIIGARPAMGKTALALHMAKHAALSGVPVVIFSLEMDASRLADRLILSSGEIQSIPYRGGWLTDPEKSIMFNSVGLIEQLPIHIDDSPNLSMKQIKARCVNLQRKNKCGMVVIDYLGLLNMKADNNAYNREQEVTQASRQAKMIAKELDVPVVLLSQLNRNIEGKMSGKPEDKSTTAIPGLSDLRESGAIEQDADVVLMIHRPEYYNSNAEKGVGIINIAKQREGKTGKVEFCYNESLTVFFDRDGVQQEGRPF